MTFHKAISLMGLGIALAYHGEVDAALATAGEAFNAAADLGEFFLGMAYAQSSQANLAAGDLAAAHEAS